MTESPNTAFRPGQREAFQFALAGPQQHRARFYAQILRRFCSGQPCWTPMFGVRLGESGVRPFPYFTWFIEA
jgi:hypothetical protein